jgi:predicted MPP superfamily phosphohydrolase
MPMSLPDAIATAGGWSPVRWIVTILAVLVVAFVAWTLIEARTLGVSRATLSSPNLPASFDGTRIVFVADIHAGPYLGRARVRSLVDRINALEPDLVILGGDYVGGRAGGKSAFYSEIGGLKAPLGVYAVLGNHDYWEGVEQAKTGLADAGITLLLNGNATVERGGESVRIAGVDDAWIGEADVKAAASGIDASEFAVLVSHSPDYFPDALPTTREIFDLALAGHTHGGQLTVFGMISPFVPSAYGQRYKGGWLEEFGVPVLVTRGAGTVTVPMRFFNPPEVNVIDLKRGPSSVDSHAVTTTSENSESTER